MDICVIKLTESAIKYGNLNLRACGKDFFPPDVFGTPNKKSGRGGQNRHCKSKKGTKKEKKVGKQRVFERNFEKWDGWW